MTTHTMTDEERDFLNNLQNELNTQDNLATAEPVYWGVMAPYEEDDCSDMPEDIAICDFSGIQYAHGWKNCATFLAGSVLPAAKQSGDGPQYVKAEPYPEKNPVSILISSGTNESGFEYHWTLRSPSDFTEFFEYVNTPYLRVQGTRIRRRLEPDAISLTQRGIDEHLKLNGHNYPEGTVSYCMNGFRCPEFEKLVNILKTVDWNG